MIKSFRDLDVYIEALDLTIEIENLIKTYPRHEQYLLVDQTRRSSRAIGPLIAEGYAKRSSIKTFHKFLNDAIGEANEMIPHLEVATRLNYIKPEAKAINLIERYDILGKKLFRLKNNWQNFK